jgi:hypothetical protein
MNYVHTPHKWHMDLFLISQKHHINELINCLMQVKISNMTIFYKQAIDNKDNDMLIFFHTHRGPLVKAATSNKNYTFKKL